MSLAADEKGTIVVAGPFEDLSANCAGTLYEIERLEFRLPKIFPVAGMAPLAYSDIARVGFAHLKCQHVDVGALRIFCDHLRQFKRRREVHVIVEGYDNVAL